MVGSFNRYLSFNVLAKVAVYHFNTSIDDLVKKKMETIMNICFKTSHFNALLFTDDCFAVYDKKTSF